VLGWYLYNIFYDRGFFPGFALRDYIHTLVIDFYGRLPFAGQLSYGEVRRRTSNLSFEQLKNLTDVDLVVTGTNLTARSVEYFSSTTTPKFPVIDAVALSMTFPIFKPVWVEDTDDVASGYWVDGGFLNNLPIHAFDARPGQPLRRDTLGDRPLNRHTLALRLGRRRDPGRVIRDYDPGKLGVKVKVWDELETHVTDLEETLLFPSEGGQLRTSAEAEQTIELATFDLATTEFSPSRDKVERPVREAYKSVTDYFGQ
jgi:NTE family protein